MGQIPQATFSQPPKLVLRRPLRGEALPLCEAKKNVLFFKNLKMKKDKFITVRYADSDLKLVMEKAKNLGITISVYIRSISLSDKNIMEIKVANSSSKNAKIDENEIRILLNIANNLNQITKLANQQKAVPQLDILINIKNRIVEYLNKKFDGN